MIHRSMPLYIYQTKCALCKAEFAFPIKIPLCEIIICGNCRKTEAVRNFIHSKICTYCEDINLGDK